MTNTRPIVDNTTQDWSIIQGQEKDGWTAVQLKRQLDTCDPMDFPIKVKYLLLSNSRLYRNYPFSLARISLSSLTVLSISISIVQIWILPIIIIDAILV